MTEYAWRRILTHYRWPFQCFCDKLGLFDILKHSHQYFHQELTDLPNQVAGDWWVVKGQNCGQDGWPGAYDWYPCQGSVYSQHQYALIFYFIGLIESRVDVHSGVSAQSWCSVKHFWLVPLAVGWYCRYCETQLVTGTSERKQNKRLWLSGRHRVYFIRSILLGIMMRRLNCPKASSNFRARRWVLDQQHNLLRGVGLCLLLSYFYDHTHSLLVGSGCHETGLSPVRGSC